MQSQLQPQETPEQAMDVAQGLISKDKAVQEATRAHLRELGPDAVEALLAILKRENKKKPLRFAVGFVAGALFVLLVGTLLDAIIKHYLHWKSTPVSSQSWLIIQIGFASGICAAASRKQRAAARALAELDDVRALGPLAEALEKQDDATIKLVKSAIIRLSPLVKPSDSHVFDARQLKCLLRALKKSEGELSLSLLRIFSEVGDSEQLEAIEKFYYAAKNEEARRAAGECLKKMRARAEKAEAGKNLLRPSSAPDNAAETLLRPAHGVGKANPELLVRPSAPDHPNNPDRVTG